MRWLSAKLAGASGAKESAVSSDTGVVGIASTHAEELRQAVKAAVECGADRIKFVNESEVVLNRLHRAVTHFRQQHFSDERLVFESLEPKDPLVHFFIDCVRNRFLFRAKVAQLKTDLSSSSSAWDRAFKDHIARCPTCRTVDLSKSSPPAPPQKSPEKLPIPFGLELLALLGTSVPLFAIAQGCDCQLRPWLVLCGAIMCLPIIIFEFSWRLRCTHSWLLWNLSAGSYAIAVDRRPLRWPWAPSVATLTRSDAVDAPKTLVSYGHWFRRAQLQVEATIIKSRPKPGLPELAQREHCISVTCSFLYRADTSVVLEPSGQIRGLPKQAAFDGNELTFTASGSETQTWTKLGRLRLDWIRKTFSALALVGLTMALVAVCFHPGLRTPCGPIETETSRAVRTPLRAIFLVDGSSSVEDQFDDEKRATEAIMEAFKEVYEADVNRLHQGVVQFSTDVKVEQSLTSDFSQVESSVRSMQLLEGGTSFEGPLRECQKMLDEYNGAGGQTFDLCILITDGVSDETNADLKAMNLLRSTTKLMGIYVGSNNAHGEKLRDLTSCATSGNQQCPFFVSAADFALLRARASELAQGVTTGLTTEVTEKTVTYECDTPIWTLSGLLLWAPFVLWWCYLNLTCPQRSRPVRTNLHKDPQRLCTAGVNEERRL